MINNGTQRDWLVRFFESQNIINDAAYELERLADAFYMTGNHEFANQLHVLQVALQDAVKNARTAISDMVAQERNDSRQRVADVFVALLNK